MWHRELCLMPFELPARHGCNENRHIKEDDRMCHSAYQSAKQLKKEKQSAEEKHASEDRKRKATIASLQQQKKQKLAELKAEAAAIDSKIASIEVGNCPH